MGNTGHTVPFECAYYVLKHLFIIGLYILGDDQARDFSSTVG
jgi:hypothetical protein